MKIFLFFSFSMLFTILIPFKIHFFIPLLGILLLEKNLIFSLWTAFFCGIILDLFSINPLGMHAVSYLLTFLIFYQKKEKFKKNPVSISIFTFLFSIFYSAIHLIISFIFLKNLKINFFYITTDFIIMPIIDGIYGFLYFYLFLKISSFIYYKKLKKR